MILDEMRERFAAALAEGRALCEKANTEKRSPTDEERTKFDTLMAESDTLKADIERQEKLEEREGWAKAVPNPEHRPRHGVRAQESDEVPSFGVMLQAAARRGGFRGYIDPEAETRATGMNEAIGSQGGFLLEPTYVAGILQKTYEANPFLSLLRRQQIGPNSNSLIMRAVDESSRAAGSRHGGVRCYWLDEAAAKTATKPKFRKMEWTPKKVAALWYATDELLQDATALTGMADMIFGEELSYEVANVVINGTGAGQPLGLLNSPALVSVAAEAGQGATTIVSQNVMKMYSRCWGPSRRNAVWLINQDIEPQLHSLSVTAGVGGVPVYLPANGLSGSPLATLYGRPVITLEQCSTLGTIGDIIFVDPTEYMLVDKGAPVLAESMHLLFNYDETCFRLVYRCDGMPLWNSALTPASGSGNTLSPIVALATRS